MVLLAGLCEFGAFGGFTFGRFTRVAEVGTALYLFDCAFNGRASDNGVYMGESRRRLEFPVLWAFICLTYVLTGGGGYSFDHFLRQHLPNALRFVFR